MEFFSLIFYLCLYYVRPHEWIGVFKILPMVKVTFLTALVVLFHKHRGDVFTKMLRTPQDWMMFFYFLWMVGTSPERRITFGQVLPLFSFYVVATFTLDTVRRMQTFLNWWTVWIMLLAALAVASQYGYDPVDSYGLTMGHMKGRLAFNTSIFNNANALGHSVVPVIVMLYFIGFWKRPVFVKLTTVALMLLPAYCVWLTVSKGSFLSGFATLLVAITFRRPIGVQFFIIVCALTLGIVAVQALPRMEEISDSKSDKAIQGRVAAFRFGMDTMKNKLTGVGWAKFEISLFRKLHFQKAAHSSYVRVGGELGLPGLFLFLGLLYTCFRTLIFAHTENDDEERIRRLLFVMLVAYAVSSWMVGWADRAIFFLMVAAVSAFHRYLQNRQTTTLTEVAEESTVFVSEPEELQPAYLPAGVAVARRPLPPPSMATPTSEIVVKPASVQMYLEKIAGIRWKRIGMWDLILILLITIATVYFWQFVMRKM